MKILITNYYLWNYAGTENYVHDIARYFHAHGHEVYVYSPLVGCVGAALRSCGITVVDDMRAIAHIPFDIIHAHHNITAMHARLFFPNTPMVFVSHGVIPQLEQPPHPDLDIALYIAVSEEVRDHLVRSHRIDANRIVIVRNFVDMDRFSATSDIHENVEKVLVISNHCTPEMRRVVEQGCAAVGASLEHVGLPDNPVENVEEHINTADVVVTIGKGVLEALACKRAVIVYDKHGADGLMKSDLYYESRKNNFSGRRYARVMDESTFVELLRSYDPGSVNALYDLVLADHTIDVVCRQLLQHYDRTIAEYDHISKKDQRKGTFLLFVSWRLLMWAIFTWYMKIRHRSKLI